MADERNPSAWWDSVDDYAQFRRVSDVGETDLKNATRLAYWYRRRRQYIEGKKTFPVMLVDDGTWKLRAAYKQFRATFWSLVQALIALAVSVIMLFNLL